MSARTEVARWNAVVARDAEQDGRFVFAVRTTGVYCKPSCALRRALRENVRFFADPGAAEAAGFRACKRCDPRATESASEPRHRKGSRLSRGTRGRATGTRNAGQSRGMSASHLQRTFTRQVGVSPRKYAAALRASRLKAHLRAGATVSRATFDAGYGASSRAYDAAAEQLGMTPRRIPARRQGRGDPIHDGGNVAGPAAGRGDRARRVRDHARRR